MNKKLIFLDILLITGLLLAACGPSSISIQLPGADNSGTASAQDSANTILIYVLLGALVVISLIALLGKRGSQ